MNFIKLLLMSFMVINFSITLVCSDETKAQRWEILFSDKQSQNFDEHNKSISLCKDTVKSIDFDDNIASRKRSSGSNHSLHSLSDWQTACELLNNNVNQPGEMVLSYKAMLLYLDLLDHNPVEIAIIQALQHKKTSQTVTLGEKKIMKKNSSCSVS